MGARLPAAGHPRPPVSRWRAAVAPVAPRPLDCGAVPAPDDRPRGRGGLGGPRASPSRRLGPGRPRRADRGRRHAADGRRPAERPRGAGGPRVRHRPIPPVDGNRTGAAQVVRLCERVGGGHPGAGPHEHRALPGRHDPCGARRASRPDRDRDRDPPLPAVRNRPHHQPHGRLGDPDRSARGGVPRCRVPAPGGAGAVHKRQHHRDRGVDAGRVRACPAASSPRAARGGPAVRPGALRRAADRRGVRGTRAVER